MNTSGINSITTQQSRSLGKGLIVVAFILPTFFLNRIRKHLHVVLALPIAGLIVGISGFLFWIGYTMATTVWERPDDYPLEESSFQ